jgi:thiamine-monophosphate kinase
LSEFKLIRTHFARIGAQRGDTTLGVGDDCALVRIPAASDLAVSIDTLVAGIHFAPDADPEGLGHKCLAVGLSDLAAMGAEPAWATLALTLPRADESWLRGFSRGFSVLARAHGVQLIGGDTTRGPLSVTVQVHGLVPRGEGVRRTGARAGDLVYVSGTLGDAALALRLLQAGRAVPQSLRQRLERPVPRVKLGLTLTLVASAMIDISDGLLADLGHILEASGTGAEIWLAEVPLSSVVANLVSEDGDDWSLPLTGGDDYELCFTLPAHRQRDLAAARLAAECPVRCVGRITERRGLRCIRPDGSAWIPEGSGYNHFADGD